MRRVCVEKVWPFPAGFHADLTIHTEDGAAAQYPPTRAFAGGHAFSAGLFPERRLLTWYVRNPSCLFASFCLRILPWGTGSFLPCQQLSLSLSRACALPARPRLGLQQQNRIKQGSGILGLPRTAWLV